MNSIRAILAVTDFERGATDAAQRAAMLAAERAAAMTLVTVAEPDALVALRDWMVKDRDLGAAVAEQARMQLDAQANGLEQDRGVRIERQVRLGRFVDEVHEASLASDLVVLGACGDPGARAAALGTLADRLVRTAERPVLVVKRPPERPYARVLVLTDFSAAADAALRAALAVAPDADMYLLHAFSIPFEGKLRLAGVSDEDIVAYRRQMRDRTLAQMERALAGANAPERTHSSVLPGDVRTEALRAVERLQPDLIAVGKQGDSLLEDMLLGSTTSHILTEAACDVLVVPRRAAAALGKQRGEASDRP